MNEISLAEIALLLAAAAIAAPLARWLKVGTVLGYLIAGIALGPFGISSAFSTYQAKEFLHIAEFGIVLLLFLIGLELRPRRLWAMRSSILGIGGSQVLISALLLSGVIIWLGLDWLTALFLGLALALSSTAFAIQVLEEKGELTQRHGRLAFSVLLFQDIAAIPLIALVPVFAVSSADVAGAADSADIVSALQSIGVILLVIVVGRFLIERVLKLIALTQVKEAMTAFALLTVVATAAVMQFAGLSPSLGGFVAGVLLADSSYRHQLEADLKPFEGLLLGLFFTAIGMSLQFDLLFSGPHTILGMVAGLILLKFAVLYGLGRFDGLSNWSARRLGLSLSQGGEFAFVLLTAGVVAGAVDTLTADIGALVVTLSMIATPLLLFADERLFPRRDLVAAPEPEELPDHDGHVIIAGLGRFGQIIARVLRARRIPFTALDLDPKQIELVKRFGNEAFYGDTSRSDILTAARIKDARAVVISLSDVEASVRTATVIRASYPNLPIFARARDRVHYHRLMELNVTNIWRETYLSALDLTKSLLVEVGLSPKDAAFTIDTFDEHDQRRLIDDYRHYTDAEKLQEQARSAADSLARIFDEDANSVELETDEVIARRQLAADKTGTSAADTADGAKTKQVSETL
ncbi:MAG: cation:proton antiporter [Pseudomonadota bacterium]